MYGGIVQGAFPIERLERKPGLTTLEIPVPDDFIEGVEIGASVGVDGVCLTVTSFDDNRLVFDVMMQTIDVTTLAEREQGHLVNLERSLIQGQEVGGHVISGHVDTTAEILSIERPENNFVLTIRVDHDWMKYIFPKGYLAVNGCSLTVAEADHASGKVTFYLIPETLRRTSFVNKKVGDRVNIEVDRTTQVMVDTIRRFLTEMMERGELTGAALQNLASATQTAPETSGVE